MKKIIKREPIRYDIKGNVSVEIVEFEDGTRDMRFYNTEAPCKIQEAKWGTGWSNLVDEKQEDDQ